MTMDAIDVERVAPRAGAWIETYWYSPKWA